MSIQILDLQRKLEVIADFLATDWRNDRAGKMDTTVMVVATPKPGKFFVANTMHNLVVEPLVEEQGM